MNRIELTTVLIRTLTIYLAYIFSVELCGALSRLLFINDFDLISTMTLRVFGFFSIPLSLLLFIFFAAHKLSKMFLPKSMHQPIVDITQLPKQAALINVGILLMAIYFLVNGSYSLITNIYNYYTLVYNPTFLGEGFNPTINAKASIVSSIAGLSIGFFLLYFNRFIVKALIKSGRFNPDSPH